MGLKEPTLTKKGPVIVIVERWLSLNISHIFWKRYLERKGFQVYIINLPLWRKDFADSSKKLASYIEKYNLNDVTLVGISRVVH